MFYTFSTSGHPNILSTHKTTLEFTKDDEVSLKGDCIVGVRADFELRKLKEFIKNSRTNKITIKLETTSGKKIIEKIFAEINQNFNSNTELVIRKTDFVSDRTFAINSNKASFELGKDLIDFLREKNNKVNVIIESKEK